MRGAVHERIECTQGDLTAENVDAIVNAANSGLSGGGGVDGAIHRVAGPGLLLECRARHPQGCPTGEVRVTGGYLLPALWVLHAVGPIWRGGKAGEAELLASCYRNSVRAARELGLRTLAAPAISCGIYGYPWREAAGVTIATLADELDRAPDELAVRVVLLGDDIFEVFRAALEEARASG